MASIQRFPEGAAGRERLRATMPNLIGGLKKCQAEGA